MMRFLRMIFLGEGSLRENGLLRIVHMLAAFAFIVMGALGLTLLLGGLVAGRWSWIMTGAICAGIGGYAILYRVLRQGWRIEWGTGGDDF